MDKKIINLDSVHSIEEDKFNEIVTKFKPLYDEISEKYGQRILLRMMRLFYLEEIIKCYLFNSLGFWDKVHEFMYKELEFDKKIIDKIIKEKYQEMIEDPKYACRKSWD